MSKAPDYSDLATPPEGAEAIPNSSDYSDLSSAPDSGPGFAEKLAPNIMVGAAKLGHELLNAPHNIVNAFSPDAAKNIPTQPDYDFEKIMKLPGTAADHLVQGIAENAPSIVMPEMKLGEGAVASAAGRAIPQAMFGAATNKDPAQGAENMGALSLAGEALPAGVKALGYVNPGKYATALLNHLGNGSSLEQNAKIVANYIRDGYNTAKSKGDELYGSVFNHNNLGSSHIYDRVNPSGLQSKVDFKPVQLSGSKELNEKVAAFNDNPSFQNAHQLQSQLGGEIRAGQQPFASLGDKQTIGEYRGVQKGLQGDINSFLDKQPLAKMKYQIAGDHHREMVAPYEQSSLYNISKGLDKNPSTDTIHKAFSNPQNGETNIANTLGDDFKNRVLFSRYGKAGTANSPEKLNNAFQQLDEHGLASYVTPKTADMMSSLGQRINYRDSIQRIMGGLAGYKATAMLGLPPLLEGAASVGLGAAAPKISKTVSAMGNVLGRHVPQKIKDISNKLGGKKLYYPAGRTGAAAYFNYQGNDDDGDSS